MLDVKLIEHQLEQVEKELKRRQGSYTLADLKSLLEKRKLYILGLQQDQTLRNQKSQALQKASKETIEAEREGLKALSQQVKQKEKELSLVEEVLKEALLNIPNLLLPEVPFGEDASKNQLVRTVLTPKTFSFTPKDHVELGAKTDIIDLEGGAKVSGSRFAFLKGKGSLLNRALLQFFCDYHTQKGDVELTPPYLVLPKSMQGTGNFPKFKEDVFEVLRQGADPLYLIPTAEVPVTNYLADEILEEAQLPLRFCAYSACFRSEAGAAGRDTRGMIRMHQFEKVEMVRFATPVQARAEHEAMVERASELLSLLELPHRVMLLCSGDTGFSSEKTYDIEVWLPGQNAYREISSCSSFGTFQSRRANIKYRPLGTQEQPKPKLEHVVTLNGSGLPLGRTLVAILENHQQADGSIEVPAVLRPYMGGLKVIA